MLSNGVWAERASVGGGKSHHHHPASLYTIIAMAYFERSHTEYKQSLLVFGPPV